MAFTVLVLHGPNLAALAEREIDPRLETLAQTLGAQLQIVQANGEEGLLDALHGSANEVDAVLVNPGVLAPVAFALAEGLAQVALPVAEVLLDAISPTRGPSALSSVAKHQVHGERIDGYQRALELLVPKDAKADDEEVPAPRGKSARKVNEARVGKSIGRKAAAPAAAEAPAPRSKTIGRGAAAEKTDKKVESAPRGTLTRSQVRDRIKARLQGKETPESLANWARQTWTGIQRGAACEAGARDTIENVLLTLMAGAKASEQVLVSQMAKLDP